MKSVLLVNQPGGKGKGAAVSNVDVPVPGPGEVLVEMKACGLCGSDLEKMRGAYTASMPVVGHEAVGVVSAAGRGVSGFRQGDRVFPHHHVPCHECYLCKSGSETMCEKYRSTSLVPGGFSEYFLVPARNVAGGGVLKLPKGMSFEVGSLIEPVACCLRALRMSSVKRGETVLIVGGGPVGMMHGVLLGPMGAKVIVSDVSEARLRFAEKAKVGLVLDANRTQVPERVRAETDGRGADLAIVASGNEKAILQGLRSIRKGGRVCLFGVPEVGTVLDYDLSELYNLEQMVFTSYAAVESDTKEAVGIISRRGREFGALITHRFPLSRFEEAVEAAASATAMKVVLTP